MTEVHELLRRTAEQVHVPPLELDALRRSARRRARRRTTLTGAAVLAAAAPVAALLAAGWPAGPPDRLAQPVGPAASGAPSVQPAPPAASLEALPRLLQVVQIDGSPWGASTAHFGRGTVTAGKDRVITPTYSRNEFQSIAVAFEPLAAPGDCVQRAVLALPPPQGTGAPGELRAYPSAALSLAEGRVPPNGGRPNTLLDNRPAGLETVHADGSRSYDVTDLVRLWSDGAPFPSVGRSVPAGSPIVVLVRPPAQDPGTYWHGFDVAASPPVLRASLSPDCPAA